MNKTAAISIRVAPEIKEAVKKAAEDDRRTLASFVEKVLVDHLKEKGYLDSNS